MTKTNVFFIQKIHFFFIILGHFLKHIFNKCMVSCTWQADDFIWKPLLSCALLPWEYIKEMHSSWNMEKNINVTFLFPSWADCILQYSLNDFYSVHESSSNTARPYRTCKTESRLNVSPCPHIFILICTLIIVALSLLSEESVNRKLWEERTVSRDYNAFVDARSVVSFRKSRPQKVFNSNRLWVGRVKPDVQIRMKLPCIVHDEERWILDRQTPGDLNTCCDVRPQSLTILQHWVVVQCCVDLWTNFL